MDNNKGFLQPEDYVEPRCVLCDEPYGKEPQVKPVPQDRIIRKMDEYMSRRDYKGAERHLKYWLAEAKAGFDKRGELLVQNELVGHFRKTANKDGAFESAKEALRLLKELDFENNVSAGTTYINIATAFNAFGENEKSIALFEKAKAVYENHENTAPELLGGLYNNMALTYVAMGEFEKAYPLYDKAYKVMENFRGGELEQAITLLNLADAYNAELGSEKAEDKINGLVDRAYDLLKNTKAPHDGYYAFVCEKCAPSFSYYGYFAAAAELKKTAEEIYERN